MNSVNQQMFTLNAVVNQPITSIQIPAECGETTVNLQDVRDFSKVCRACATITEFVVPIFSDEGLQYNLEEKINKHMPIKVSKSDVLPHVVCYQCTSQLLAWHELVKCCVQADAALRSKIAADTQAQTGNKEPNPPNLRPDPTSQENPLRQYLNDIRDYVDTQSVDSHESTVTRDPPKYTPPHRRCDFCNAKVPETDFKEHILNIHAHRIFYCGECQQYKDRKVFLSHMKTHGTDINNKIKYNKKEKRVKFKTDKDVNQNNNDDSETTNNIHLVQDAETPRNEEENEFSDHSDNELGFGPLPESVFEAIEDSQDIQPSEDQNTRLDTETLTDKSTEPSLSQENISKKPLRKSRTCPICSKVYTAPSSFFYHMKYTHKKIKDHECTICKKTFGTKASLASHMTTHSTECQFECKECQKRFRSKASLYIHEQTHTGVKTWSCSQCSTAFRWKTHLLRHMKRHSSEKAHVCATCGRGFSVRCDLLRHMRTHEAGSYECDKCCTKFAQMRYLKVHMNNKHLNKASKNSKPP